MLKLTSIDLDAQEEQVNANPFSDVSYGFEYIM